MNHQITKRMDLQDDDDDDDWEYLPDSPPLNLNDTVSLRSISSSLFDMDYFSDHPHPPPPNNLFVPFQFPPSPTLIANDVVQRLLLQTSQQQQEEEVLMMNMSNNNTDVVSVVAASTLSFKKESTESVDMNKFLESTASTSPTRMMMMQKITVLDDLFNQDEIARNLMIVNRKCREDEKVVKGEVNWIGEGIIGDEYEMADDDGLNLWKLGFGAICSFGFAAATVCLILFGNQKAKQSHKLHFQIYGADDQRMKQASKFNEAMSAAVRGVPLNRAHITYGGYYENSI